VRSAVGRVLGNKQGAGSAGRRRGVKSQLWVEALEARCLLDSGFRSISGFGNNIAHPTEGVGGTDLIRVSPVAYFDGISAPSRPNNLNPRLISNNLSNQSDPIFSFANNLGNTNSRELSDYAYAFGQFIDHDMDLTLDNSGTAFNIPADTRTFPGGIKDPMGVEPFTRSQFDATTGTSRSNPRQQINLDTSFLDLSQVYGSTDAVSSILRSHVGGQLRTSPGDFLPRESSFTAAELAILNRDEGGIANDAHQVPDSELFVAGDKRVNENVELTSQQTLFMRNHNRLAGQLHSLHPDWSDELLFQEARKINIAEYQNIVFNGYVPSIIGTNGLPAYTGYKPGVDPAISTEFSTVGFRFGHSLLSTTVGRDNNDGTGITDVNANGSAIDLTEDFFRPDLLNNNHVTVNLLDRFGNPDPHTSSTVGEVLKALSDGLPNEFDLRLIDQVRSLLFGIPNAPGTDLAARDIQRARDHGIGTYNQVRVAFGLAPVSSYAQISSDPAVQAALAGTYGPDTPADVNKIDPFIGMLAEDIIPGSDVGVTVRAILSDQFARLRDGDRFLFLNEGFNSEEQALFNQGDDYADVIQNNTSITNLQGDVFFNRLEISGTVFFDPDGNGVREPGERGIQGVTVELHDAATGALISSVVTDVNGEYDFTELDGTIPATGNYTLKLVMPPGFTQNATQIAHNPGEIRLSRGDLQIDGQDFALKSALAVASGIGQAPADSGTPSSPNATVVSTLATQSPAPTVTATVTPAPAATSASSASVTQADAGPTGTPIQSGSNQATTASLATSGTTPSSSGASSDVVVADSGWTLTPDPLLVSL
jgi:hypothetical protein